MQTNIILRKQPHPPHFITRPHYAAARAIIAAAADLLNLTTHCGSIPACFCLSCDGASRDYAILHRLARACDDAANRDSARGPDIYELLAVGSDLSERIDRLGYSEPGQFEMRTAFLLIESAAIALGYPQDWVHGNMRISENQ